MKGLYSEGFNARDEGLALQVHMVGYNMEEKNKGGSIRIS